MASTQRVFTVQRDLDQVWAFVSDMGNWAAQMPGYQSHEMINADDSAWTLNVDLGPFQRSIVVDVHVSRWQAPNEVDFEVKGRYEPFTGSGAFRAARDGSRTRITLDFGAEPGGSMARMIAPLVGPVLERVAGEFSANLASALGGEAEEAAGEADAPPVQRGFAQRVASFFRALRRKLSGA